MFYDSEGNIEGVIPLTMLQWLTREAGKLKPTVEIPTDFNLKNSISKISGEDKRMFLDFVSRMLKWQPKDRGTAKDLLNDPWLSADFSENT